MTHPPSRLEPIATDVWATTAPFRFLSFAIGARMTVVRLPDGGLVLHSPIAIDASLRAALDALGPVRHVVCPNVFHHLYAAPALALYPEAALHAPPALAAKRPDLRIDHELGGGRSPGSSPWGGALETADIEGSMLKETVFFHAATGTLVSSDLLEYFERCDETWTRLYLRAAGVYRRPTWNRLLRIMYRDRRAARRSIDRVLAWPIERVTIAHGDVITHAAHDAVRDGFAWL